MTVTAAAPTPGRTWNAHAAVTLFFALLACAYSYPLVFHLSTHIPGPPGDNFAFLWNFWWTRHALATGESIFECPYLFAPAGTSLVLNTHAAVQSLAGATLLAPLSIVTAHNVVLLAGLAGNGIATYALAYSHVHRVMPAVLGGVIFATSAYIGLHLLGHFNLVFAWVLPAAALAWTRYVARPSRGAAAFVAVTFALVLYSDYYYFVYALLFAVIWTAASTWRLSIRPGPARSMTVERVLLVLMGLVTLIIATIAITGGVDINLAGSRISARGIRNPTTGLWVLFLVWLGVRLRVTLHGVAGAGLRPIATNLPWAAVIGAVLALPLLGPAVAMPAAGDYVAARYLWRSAPGGIDTLALVAGNPAHAWYGSRIIGLFDRLEIGIIDQAGWIGLVPIAIAIAVSSAGSQTTAEQRRWFAVAVAFFVWSLGPFLLIAGRATGIMLPQFFVRFVPILSNARIPGRGFVMVTLAAAVLCALVASERRWRPRTLAALAALAMVDGLVAPYPLSIVPPPGLIEQRLLADPRRGSILLIPTGYQDGFAMVGQFDPIAFVRQMQHGRPIVGGYASRLSHRIKTLYDDRPAIAALLALSAPGATRSSLEFPDHLDELLAADGVAFVVVTRQASWIPARADLERRGLTFVMTEGERELYQVGR